MTEPPVMSALFIVGRAVGLLHLSGLSWPYPQWNEPVTLKISPPPRLP
jgi:hypothetical protein